VWNNNGLLHNVITVKLIEVRDNIFAICSRQKQGLAKNKKPQRNYLEKSKI
jgi:hypothetical protein